VYSIPFGKSRTAAGDTFGINLIQKKQISMQLPELIEKLSPERSAAFKKLRDTIAKNIPGGFKEKISETYISYCVPHSLFPDGYHCDPSKPLPFMSIASQKNFIALYHMGLYGDPALLKWFSGEYPKHAKTKLDMGKSCVRFKKMDDIPFGLIAELCTKMTPQEWIRKYQSVLKK
jgi:hypothetical protein